MTQEVKKGFGTLPEELTEMLVGFVDAADLPSLRGVSTPMRRLTYDRFVAENFADLRTDISVKSLSILGDITAHQHFCHDVKRISFRASSIESVGGIREEAQEVWLTFLLTQILRNLKDAGQRVHLGMHRVSTVELDDRADTTDELAHRAEAMLRRAIDEAEYRPLGITLEDDLGEYLVFQEIGAADSVCHRALWKTKLPLDRFPREASYESTTGTMVIKCSNCTVETLPPTSPGECACLMSNLEVLDLTGPGSNKPVRTLRLEDCATYTDEILSLLRAERDNIEAVELINLHLFGDRHNALWGEMGEWNDLPDFLKELTDLKLSTLTLSDVVRTRDYTIPMSSVVVIQEGDSEVFEGKNAILEAMDRWIQANPE